MTIVFDIKRCYQDREMCDIAREFIEIADQRYYYCFMHKPYPQKIMAPAYKYGLSLDSGEDLKDTLKKIDRDIRKLAERTDSK